MDFTFGEGQQAIRELAREILSAEATPERVREVESGTDWFDAPLWSKLADANLLGIAIEERHGGMGFGFGELCVLVEEIGRVVAPLPALPVLVLGAGAIAEFGTEAQRAAWLPRIAAGEARVTAALGAPGALDAAPRARGDGDGFVLDGSVSFVPFTAQADAVLVLAHEDDGLAGFIVDARAPGVDCRAERTSTGEPLATLGLAGVHVGAESRIRGAEIARWWEERALVAIAALQLGVSSRALEITTDYVKEREQFGVPIGSFQAVQHRCADAFIDVEALRWTTVARGLASWPRGLPASAGSAGWPSSGPPTPVRTRCRGHDSSPRRTRLRRGLPDPPSTFSGRKRPGARVWAARGPSSRASGRDMARTGPLLTGVRHERIPPLSRTSPSATSCLRLDVPITRGAHHRVARSPLERLHAGASRQGSGAVVRGSTDIIMNILTTNGYVGRYVTDWAGPDAPSCEEAAR